MSGDTVQRVFVSLASSAIGTLVLKYGIDTVVDERTREALAEHQQQLPVPSIVDMEYMGMALAGLGLIMIILGAHTLGTTIARTLFKVPLSPEELWESMSDSLVDRLSQTVLKGYRRVTIYGDDAAEVMRLKNQVHIKFVGQEGAVIKLSGIFASYIKKQLLLESKESAALMDERTSHLRPTQQVTQMQQTQQLMQKNLPSL